MKSYFRHGAIFVCAVPEQTLHYENERRDTAQGLRLRCLEQKRNMRTFSEMKSEKFSLIRTYALDNEERLVKISCGL